MSCQIKVIVKDEEKTLRKKFLIYDPVSVDDQDPIIRQCVNEVLKNFDGEPSDISVKIDLEIV